MMKRIFALFCAAMLLFCAAAYADESAAIDFLDRFELRGKLPDGWRCTIVSQNDLTLEADAVPEAADPTAPRLNVYISFNESYASVNTLKDLDETEMELLRRTFDEYTVDFDSAETDSGVSLLVARESGDDLDFLVLYTIWQGYEIELTLLSGEAVPGRILTDEQVQKCLSYAKTLEIGPIQ